jgi:hypothetical protein
MRFGVLFLIMSATVPAMAARTGRKLPNRSSKTIEVTERGYAGAQQVLEQQHGLTPVKARVTAGRKGLPYIHSPAQRGTTWTGNPTRDGVVVEERSTTSSGPRLREWKFDSQDKLEALTVTNLKTNQVRTYRGSELGAYLESIGRREWHAAMHAKERWDLAYKRWKDEGQQGPPPGHKGSRYRVGMKEVPTPTQQARNVLDELKAAGN